MHDKDHGGKHGVYGCQIRPNGRISESGVQSSKYAQRREHGDFGPIDLLEIRVAVETIVDARKCRSPHQDYDSELVQSIAESLYSCAVIAD